MVKRLPTMRETWVQSLGWEDLLEKEIATHSSILAWKIPWTEESGRLQSMRAERSYSTFKVRRGSSEEIPLVQGKRNPSKTVGVGRGHQRADTLKP